MRIAPLLYKQLNPYFKKRGFIKSGSTYYKVENDIAFCITLEFPSSVRTWCHILPLYIPTEFKHLTYGNDIDSFYRSVRDTLSKHDDVSDEQINIWIEKMTDIFEYDVFPFFNSILTPRALLEYCELPANMRNKYLPYTGGRHMLRLQGYTALYLGETKIAKRTIKSLKESVLQDRLIAPSLVNQHIAEADEMTKMFSLSSSERTILFKKISEATLKNCFSVRK